jgi:uncharacterized membrane protein YsdA (DUF1294 family)
MHYVTDRSHRMQKHRFGVTCPSALFVESVLVPPEHEKKCGHISWPGCTIMQYVTHKSHRMQKHKFSVMCLLVLFMETTPGQTDHEK